MTPIVKRTEGFVDQQYDSELGKWTSAEFTAHHQGSEMMDEEGVNDGIEEPPDAPEIELLQPGAASFYKYLCFYDPRRENYFVPGSQPNPCLCDNCFHGLTPPAEVFIRALEATFTTSD